MATGAYEGGAGGKIRRRPQRAGPATPYDRPAASARDLRVTSPLAASNGWLSKLVDPASRFIASSASRLFSSVFRKRLPPPAPAPAPASGQSIQSRQEYPKPNSVNPSFEILHVGSKDGKNQGSISDDKGINELQQLLMRKTFTRDEFDHLTELLRSRTIESDVQAPACSNEKKTEETISAIKNEGGIISPEMSPHPGGSIANNLLRIPKDEAASPAELAKAYMSFGSIKGSPSNLRLRSQLLFLEDKASDIASAAKPSGLTSVPGSIARVSRLGEPPQNGYMTPRSRGRSAIYRMSRSPFFKGANSSIDVSPVPSSSHQTPMSMHSGGRQVLKRRSAFLDNEIGSVGPIRRIRQKSNMMSPLRSTRPGHNENLLPNNSPVLHEDVVLDIASYQNPDAVNKLNHGNTDVQDEDSHDRMVNNDVPLIPPPNSNQMAIKILKHLDNMMPSPKDKSSEPNGVGGDEQPLKLAQAIPRRYVSKNMKGTDSLQIIDAQHNGGKDVSGDPSLPGTKVPSPKHDEAKGNNTSNLVVSGAIFASHGHVTKTIKSAANAMLSKSRGEEFSDSASLPSSGKLGFQMIITEDCIESDDDHTSSREAPVPVNKATDKVDSKISEQQIVPKIQDNKALTSETPIPERPLISISGNKPLFSSVSSSEFDKKSPLSSVTSDNNNGFAFNVGVASFSHSELPPMPTMTLPENDVSSIENEQRTAPVFAFGLKQSSAPAVSLNTTGSGIKADKSFAESTILDGSTLDKGDERGEARDLLKPSEKFASSEASASSVPPVSGSGVAASPSLSNGLLHSTPKFSAAPVSALSDNPAVSSAAPTFATAHPFHFGSITPTALQTSASLTPNESSSTDADAKPARKRAFGIDGVSSVGTSSSLNPGGSSLNLITSPSMATPSMISSTTWSNISAASSMAGGQSVSASSFSFTSAGSSILLSSATAQSTSTSSLVTFGATTGAAYGSQSAQSDAGAQQVSQSSGSQFSSLVSTPTFGFGSSPFGLSATISKPLSSSSGFTFPSTVASSSAANSSSQPVATNIFSNTLAASTTPIFGTTFGSSASPSTGFAFGQSASTLGSSFTFGSQPGTGFSFPATSTTANSSSIRPAFGMPTANMGFGSGSPTNDQMNVEDSMADDTSQIANSMIPAFGQPGSSPTTTLFNSPAIPSGGSIFQFGNHQNPAALQSPSPFQASGGIDFASTGSFSLGSGGGDKSTRRFVKVRRQKK